MSNVYRHDKTFDRLLGHLLNPITSMLMGADKRDRIISILAKILTYEPDPTPGATANATKEE